MRTGQSSEHREAKASLKILYRAQLRDSTRHTMVTGEFGMFNSAPGPNTSVNTCQAPNSTSAAYHNSVKHSFSKFVIQYQIADHVTVMVSTILMPNSPTAEFSGNPYNCKLKKGTHTINVRKICHLAITQNSEKGILKYISSRPVPATRNNEMLTSKISNLSSRLIASLLHGPLFQMVHGQNTRKKTGTFLRGRTSGSVEDRDGFTSGMPVDRRWLRFLLRCCAADLRLAAVVALASDVFPDERARKIDTKPGIYVISHGPDWTRIASITNRIRDNSQRTTPIPPVFTRPGSSFLKPTPQHYQASQRSLHSTHSAVSRCNDRHCQHRMYVQCNIYVCIAHG